MRTNTHIEQKISALISGETIAVNPENRAEIKRRLREIKKNCTIVLSQLNDKNF